MSPSRKPVEKKTQARKASAKTESSGTALLDVVPQPPPLKPAPLKIEPPRTHQQEGRYVYGVIESRTPVPFGRSSIGGVSEEVYTVHHGDIAAVVSRTPVFIF